MNRPTRAAALTAALMATCLLAPGTTAHAASGDWLSVAVTRPGTTGGGTRTALLLRDPPQDHPRAVEACAELNAVDGDFSRPGDSAVPSAR
ncbi:SSI family serine proteinase inhibitor [Streptomyces griseoluteus]